MTKKRALIISFEGIEGTGKSTQCRLLSSYLRKKGLRVMIMREPGSSAIGEEIRRILLHGKGKLTPLTETLLFLAARSQLCAEKIRPNLVKKDVIILDRYIDATMAYQGYGVGVDRSLIKRLNAGAVKELVPDVTLLLDVAPKTGLARSGRNDRFERRTFVFFEKVRRGYLALAKADPKRIKIIPSDTTIGIMREQIRGIVERAYEHAGKKR